MLIYLYPNGIAAEGNAKAKSKLNQKSNFYQIVNCGWVALGV